MEKVHFLGHVISKEGVLVDSTKAKAIVNWPRPTNITKVQSFVGMAGYYRIFIRGFSKLALQLIKLLCNDNRFACIEEYEASFQELKQHLVSTPVLTTPKENEGFVAYSDASR